MQLRRSLVTWLVALLACFLVLVPVASLGLAVPEEIIIPLSMMLGALSAAVAASWAANLWVGDESRSRILAVVGWTEVAAALLTAIFMPLVLFAMLDFGLIVILRAFAVIVAGCATVAALRLRAAGGGIRRDAAISLIVVALGVAVLLVSLLVTCATTGCMA